jgi:hypothetical protein
MSELQEAHQQTAKAVSTVADEHSALLHNRRFNDVGEVGDSPAFAGGDIGRMCTELASTWNELKVPAEDRVVMLTQLINECPTTPGFLRAYDEMSSKLRTRIPINELISKKKYLEYRLSQQAKRRENSEEMTALTGQLDAITQEIHTATFQYESRFGQKFQ